MRSAANPSRSKVERGADLNTDGNVELCKMPVDPSFALGLAKRNEDNVGPG